MKVDFRACFVFNYIPDLHWRETRSTVSGKWPAARESRKFRLNSTSSIVWIIRLIADELFNEVFAQVSQQPNTNLARNINLKRKRQCKIWRFSWPKPIVSHFCSLEPLSKITRGTKRDYVIIGRVWPRNKPWTIYTSRSRLMEAVARVGAYFFWNKRSYCLYFLHALPRPKITRPWAVGPGLGHDRKHRYFVSQTIPWFALTKPSARSVTFLLPLLWPIYFIISAGKTKFRTVFLPTLRNTTVS